MTNICFLPGIPESDKEDVPILDGEMKRMLDSKQDIFDKNKKT